MNEDICECVCHSDPSVMHCFPCCDKCPFCEQRIRSYKIPTHHARCAALTEMINKIPTTRDLPDASWD